jgi:hypothetical protein
MMMPPRRTRSGGHMIVKLLMTLFLVGALATAGFFYWQHTQEQANREQLMTEVTELNSKIEQLQASPTPMPSPIPTPIPSPSPSPSPDITPGTITGKLSYPSEMSPKQRICAVNQTTQIETCTENYQGMTYKLLVPAATYQVYATLAPTPENGDAALKTKAYYSEFVTCGLKYGCPSHKPIDIVVKAGETVQNIDPGDWYAQ